MPAREELVEAFARRRDEASFRELYRRTTPMLFSLALRLAGSRSEAEDLTQEAWIRAVERIDVFDWRSRFSTWLTGILINCNRERVRRSARESPTPDADGEEAVVIEAFPNVLDAAASLDVERALAQLAPGYREVVLLHDVYGYTHAEIAGMLGVEEGASKSQLARGRARLRGLLQQAPAHDKDQGGTP